MRLTVDGLSEARAALTEFRQHIHRGDLTPATATRLATGAAAAFLRHHNATGGYLADAITLLCEMATLAPSPLAQAGLLGLFPHLIERLGDAFEPSACALYNRVFVQVIQHCRRLPGARALDAQLRRFGLLTANDLLARALEVRRGRRFDRRGASRIEKVFVLSRVTLGAEIAITSLVLAKLQQVCPAAALLLLGGPKSRQLFAGDPRVSVISIDYGRSDGLLARLASWLAVVAAVERETTEMDPSEYVIVDPDSRLTQLGLLPLTLQDRSYYFFESRSYRAPGLHSLGELTADWLGQVFGTESPVYPYVAPSEADLAFARAIMAAARSHRRGPVVSVNLGVGANPSKRLPNPFERLLLARLLQEGAVVILDKGGDEEEVARVEQLAQVLEAQGARRVTLDATSVPVASTPALGGANLITWQGEIGRFGALIGESDAYIGYDSACQHLAAALGVPTIDIFTGFTGPRMPERWRPYGRGPVRMAVVDSSTPITRPALDGLVGQVWEYIGGLPHG